MRRQFNWSTKSTVWLEKKWLIDILQWCKRDQAHQEVLHLARRLNSSLPDQGNNIENDNVASIKDVTLRIIKCQYIPVKNQVDSNGQSRSQVIGVGS